jgi:PAS domain S-box-containing protein
MVKDANKHKAPTDADGRYTAEGRSLVRDGRARGGCDMFFAAVRMSPVPMCLSDPNRPDNPLVFVNRAFEDLTGYPEEEILGRNCRFLQGPETDRAVAAEVGRSIAARVDVSVESYNYRKDGSGFWNALYLSPVFSDAGDLLYFFGSQLDVTKRREAEGMLRRSRHLNALGSMATGMAHELDSLMTIVRGSLEQARANPSSELRSQQLAHAAWGAEQAERLTQQLLGFAQRQPQDTRPAEPGPLARDLPSSGPRGGGRPAAWTPALVPPSDGDARPSWPTPALDDGAVALVLRPVRVDTQGEDEEGCLVFGDERLVAVLVRLSGQHGALAGRWHLEHGFGMLDGPEHPCFTSLDAARGWVGQRLGRTGRGYS